MPFIAICPQCRVRRFRVPSRKRGEPMECPDCKITFPLIPCDEPPEPAPASPTDDTRRMALAAVGAAGVALLISQFPFGRISALACTVAGLAIASLGLDRRIGLGWVAVALNGFVLVLLVAAPASLGLSGWWPEAAQQADAHPSDEWVDAGEAAWELDGVQVALTFAAITGDRSDPSIHIGGIVTNVGRRPIEFPGWNQTGSRQPTLMLRDGIELPARPPGRTARTVTIPPDQSEEFLLVFRAPEGSQDLLLDLPSEGIRGTAPVRFRIPHAHIHRE